MGISNKLDANKCRDHMHWVDICKGIAIILVVLGHVISNGVSSQIISRNDLQMTHDIIYSFHMPLFFFLSGFLMRKLYYGSIKNGANYIVRKEIGLFVPYVVFSFLYVISKILLGSTGAVNNPVTLASVLLIFYEPVGELWYLYALMLFCIVYFVVTCVYKSASLFLKYSALLTCTCLLLLGLHIWMPQNNLLFPGIKRAMPFGVYFFSGCLFREATDKLDLNFLRNIYVKIAAPLMALIVLALRFMQIADNKLLRFFTAVLIILSFVCWSYGRKNRLIEYLGRNSMPIYLMHVYVIVICKMIYGRIPLHSEWGFCAVTLIVSVTVPVLAYELIIKQCKFLDFFINTGKYLPKAKKER